MADLLVRPAQAADLGHRHPGAIRRPENGEAQHLDTIYKVGKSASKFLSEGRKFADAYRMVKVWEEYRVRSADNSSVTYDDAYRMIETGTGYVQIELVRLLR